MSRVLGVRGELFIFWQKLFLDCRKSNPNPNLSNMSTTLPDVNHTKSRMDQKLYRQIILPNGLHCVLVQDTVAMKMQPNVDDYTLDDSDSDSDSDMNSSNSNSSDSFESPTGYRKAAAALVVGCGSFFDPSAAQGLAHFLEHMLFMGSEKFPTENSYDEFISKMGGDSNAYTELEHTNFHFEINQGACFDKALDMFAQFFISPLMLAEAADRELKNVDSEFNQSRNSDSSRLQQLFCHTNQIPLASHPFSTFSWGNIQSLKTLPEAANISIPTFLLDMFNKYYYAKVSERACVHMVLCFGPSLN